MSSQTLLAAPLVLGMVLLISGIAKLRDPADDALAALRELHVPEALVRPWVARLHPWAEIAVGIGLLVLPAPARWLAAVAALGLIAAYTWLVAAALRRRAEVRCSCFGRRSEVVRRSTLARNLVLTGAAVLTVAEATVATAPLGRVLGGGLDLIAWAGALAATGVLGWLIGIGQAAPAPSAARSLAAGAGPASSFGSGRADVAAGVGADALDGEHDGDLDDERAPIPEVQIVTADGHRRPVAELVTQRAAVLLLLNKGCGSCEALLGQLDAWRTLLPEIAVTPVRIVGHGERPELGEPFPGHTDGLWIGHEDAHAFGAQLTPAAVLLGADGLIAGGPVRGAASVRALLGEIVEHLAGAA